MTELELKKTANEVRKNIVTAVYHAHSGHPGGSLSAADILTYLYFEEMNVEPKDPRKADRDRFVLSKGHAAPGLYSALAERGYIDKEELKGSSCRLFPAGTSGYEAYTGRGYVIRFTWTGHFRSSRYGSGG